MRAQHVDLDKLEEVLSKVPKGTPWFYVLYAYIISVMRRNNGNKTRTSEQIKMPLRTLRYKLGAVEVLGFDIPAYNYSKKDAA